MKRLYLLSSFALVVIVVIVMSQWTIATILMLLILATSTSIFGSYLVYATFIRRKEDGSIAFLVPFLFGVCLLFVTIKCLSVIYQII
jgi:hypothetical protein